MGLRVGRRVVGLVVGRGVESVQCWIKYKLILNHCEIENIACSSSTIVHRLLTQSGVSRRTAGRTRSREGSRVYVMVENISDDIQYV